ncbi:response regulator transcription factor [Bdellovibrio sp. HCB-162]|uniref:response regulator transcription factor n=1 Tax=Bdellovibrio sp. HCB-162 TaxID=3394234 RepID=UPI0039BCDF58
MRCFIVEDHPLTRDGMRMAFQEVIPQCEIIGEASDVSAAVERILSLSPQVVFLDHTLKGGTGIDVIEKVRESALGLRYILVTQTQDRTTLQRYRNLGVRIFISKLNTKDEMKAAMEHFQRGTSYICPSLQEIMNAPNPAEVLTRRELEVVKLIATGKTNKEVANVLGCTDHTVKTHKANIMEKLNCSTSVEITVWALKNLAET